MTRDRSDNFAAQRVHAEPHDPLRDPFEIDRRRIIECTAFRRLQHKTQAFGPGAHDHFRTRLTHTLEAADIARCLASNLNANVHLAEAITLAHDLGHPPFGHAGESALNELMSAHGGFNHNAHSLRVVEHLEHPFPAFRGLNLTRGTLDGLRDHSSRYDEPSSNSQSEHSLEAVISSIADRIAYNCHDLEDAIGAGLLDSDALMDVPLWRDAVEMAPAITKSLPIHAIRRMALDRIINRLISDAVDFISRQMPPSYGTDSEPLNRAMIQGFSPEVEARLQELEVHLAARVYQSPAVVQTDSQGREMIQALFAAFVADPQKMPDRFANRIGEEGLHRIVCDYIAGMTDRFCDAEYRRMCS
ncbi:MAG: dNTP triphosphohydrolase [Planctomycetes bacterium]|nr:dNTP triphosphohydrolase [Planctomycetota bacterium]MBI3833728.1 dNTP triphosphohydrolase [Planctomycetota bacterium]